MTNTFPPSRPGKTPPRSMAVAFRSAIEAAEQAGTDRSDMILRLTLRDASNLRRDSALAVEDISFTDGEMRLLKVRVVTGGVDISRLDLDEAQA